VQRANSLERSQVRLGEVSALPLKDFAKIGEDRVREKKNRPEWTAFLIQNYFTYFGCFCDTRQTPILLLPGGNGHEKEPELRIPDRREFHP